MLSVDAGHLYRRSHALPDEERLESEAKAGLIAEALSLGGIDAMLPGRGEDAFGRAFLEGLATKYSLPYVVSNAECSSPLPWPVKREFERGGAKIEVYGVWSSNAQLAGCRPTDPIAALRGAAVGDTVVIVLSDQSEVEDEALVREVPAIDLIVRSDSNKALGTPDVLPNGGLLFSSGGKGKTVGVTSITLTPGAAIWRDAGAVREKATNKDNAAERVAELKRRVGEATDEKDKARLEKQLAFWNARFAKAEKEVEVASTAGGPANTVLNELRGLGPDIGEHEATNSLVAKFKEAQTGLPPLPALPAGTLNPSEPPPASPFVGNSACATCHPAQTAQWQTTAHAAAWASLVAASRPFDNDCWRCHVTGAFTAGGPTDPRVLGGLENVGCEACHGPGRAHTAGPDAGRLVKNPPVSQCTQCHDKEQEDGRFDEAIYRPKVVH